jgi:uncharacterized protein (TIGR02145 family)
LKLIQPNGGEIFLGGSDSIITWEGVTPDEPVTIEYRTDDKQPWVKLSDTAKGLSYKFHVSKIASDKYLARVTAKFGVVYEFLDVQICNQIWMGRDLDVYKYRNGDTIPEVRDLSQWRKLTTGAWCYYNNDSLKGKIYSKLYNWYAVNDPRGLAPEGWHIPTDAEWYELENCLGGEHDAGSKLKTIGTIELGDGLWQSPNAGATNESGFSGLPNGYRSNDGIFWANGSYGIWWSSTESIDDPSFVWYRVLNYGNTSVTRANDLKVCGFSVRCVRDK